MSSYNINVYKTLLTVTE